ncbi:MAG: hypothetical protein ACI8TP_003640 [Acidimicrobiales bacterium]|jgi:hypothetical protein
MGLRRLAVGEWLELRHPERLAHQAEKARLMEADPGELFVVAEGLEETGYELQTEIASEHQHQQLSPPSFDPSLHPLDAAGRTVKEDLCLRTMKGDTLVLSGGSVCFPTRWTLREKVGNPLDLVHEPVPGYSSDLADRVRRFVDRLGPGPGVWRSNWSLMPTAELCLPGRHDHLPTRNEPEDLWFRTERQTLRRLPVSRAVVFTIGIDVMPLAEVKRNPEQAEAFALELAQLSPEFRSYKGLTEQSTDIINFL